jgi:hypothetical protein
VKDPGAAATSSPTNGRPPQFRRVLNDKGNELLPKPSERFDNIGVITELGGTAENIESVEIKAVDVACEVGKQAAKYCPGMKRAFVSKCRVDKR